MNKKRKVLIAILPILVLCFVVFTNVSYADVRVNITEEKTEPYSNEDSNTVIIENDNDTPLNNSKTTYESQVDYDNDTSNNQENNEEVIKQNDSDTEEKFESQVDTDQYESIVDVDDGEVPGTDSYYKTTFKNNKSSNNDNETDYVEEHYIKKLKKDETYEIVNKDLIVQNTTVATDDNKIKYTTLPKGTEVKLVGFTNPGSERYAELIADDGNFYYENVKSFYNNSILASASPLSRYFKSIITDAKMLGSEKGYMSCITFALIYLIGTLLLIKFLDSSIFRLRESEIETYPYINSVARIMPGAMIGSFIIIANMFDSNAVGYYFFKGFNILGKNYELIHWLIQIVLLFAIYMVWRFVLEGLKCFTFPCMVIRSIILIVANIASAYLCYALSYVGIAVYVLFVLYQCICVNSYGCADFAEADFEEAGDGGEEESSEEGGEEGSDEGSEGEAQEAPEGA